MMKTRLRRAFCSSLLACVILVSAFVPTVAPASAATKSPTGVMVPLFSYLGPSWPQLIKFHQQYPTVPVVAVVDPVLGPGLFRDPSFQLGVQSLQNAGI